MKKLAIAFVAVCLSVTGYAQKLELGFNAGTNYSTTPAEKHFGYAFSGQGAYNICDGFQVGVKATVMQMLYEQVMNGEMLSSSIPPVTTFPDIYTSNAQGFHTIRAFANAKRNMGNVTFYSGVSGGVVKAIQPRKVPVNALDNGYVAGVQAGATYNLGKRIGLNAELGADYMRLAGNGGDYDRSKTKTSLSAISMPITVGFRYRLSCPCTGTCPVKDKKAAE